MLDHIPLNYYALSGLLNFIASFVLSIFVFSNNPKSSVNRIFSVFALISSGWGLSHFLWLSTLDNNSLAEFYLRTVMLFVIFVPATFTHFILVFLKVDFDKRVNIANHFVGFLLGLTVYTRLFAKDMSAFLVFSYWLKPGPVFHFHLIHFLANIVFSHVLMLRTIKHQSGIFRNQILYIFIGTSIGYSAGVLNYCPWYRISIPPFLNPLVSVYVASLSYAIIRYRLMDIRIFAARFLIFTLVYVPILSIPYAIAYIFKTSWVLPTILETVFAPGGLFVYLRIQERAERLLVNQFASWPVSRFRRTKGVGRSLISFAWTWDVQSSLVPLVR